MYDESLCLSFIDEKAVVWSGKSICSQGFPGLAAGRESYPAAAFRSNLHFAG